MTRANIFLISTSIIMSGFAAPNVVAQSSYSSHYSNTQCSNSGERSRNKAIGGLIGGIGGGLLGREVAGDKNEKLGTILGAVGGAVISSEIAKNLTPCDKELVEKSTNAALETGTTKTWRNSETGRSGSVSVSSATIKVIDGEEQICRTKQTNVSDGGDNSKSSSMKMCKGADGTWVRV